DVGLSGGDGLRQLIPEDDPDGTRLVADGDVDDPPDAPAAPGELVDIGAGDDLADEGDLPLLRPDPVALQLHLTELPGDEHRRCPPVAELPHQLELLYDPLLELLGGDLTLDLLVDLADLLVHEDHPQAFSAGAVVSGWGSR